MAHLPTEEREFLFELGFELNHINSEVQALMEIHRLEPTRSKDWLVQNIKVQYEHFSEQVRQKYGLEVQSDFPANGSPNQIQQFFKKQSHIVMRYIYDQLEFIKTQFMAGKVTSDIFHYSTVLWVCREAGDNVDKTLDTLNSHIKTLLDHAEVLDGDKIQLKRILEDIKDNPLIVDANKGKVKILLCGGRLSIERQSEVKRSEVDPTRVITDECWCVSLVRLPDRNAQHAFLVLEGKEHNKSMIWFADFVAKEWFDTLRPGTQEGMIRIKHLECKESTDKLLFQCNLTLMEVGASDRLLFSSWLITESTARRLIHNIKEEAKNPPKYHILGNNSVAALSSGKSSSNPTGHNCFTFAKKILRDLNDVHIQLPEDSLETWIFSATSRYLIDKRLQNREWYEKPSYQMMAMFIFGLVVATVFLKYF